MSILDLLKRNILNLRATHWVYLLLYGIIFFLGIILVMTRETLFVAIGGSLIATAIVGWVLFLRVWLSRDDSRRLEMLRKFGIIDAFEHRSIPIKKEYDTRLNHAHESIDIIGFGLRALKEDYCQSFATWGTRAKVRILLLDPEFPDSIYCFANQRDKEEKNNSGTIRQDVHDFVKECAGLLKNNQLNFQIRLYRCLPSVNIFRIDGDLFWGPYLIGNVSRNFPTFIVEQHGVLYNRLRAHFDEIWSNDTFSRQVPSEWLKSNATASKS